MKKTLLIVGVIVGCALLVTQLTAKGILPLKSASFSWALTTFDFGKVKLNKPVTHKFTFTNSGDTPLVVSSVQASCGCTVTEYTKDPIEPGGEGFVKATYDAAKVGVFTKTVTVNANTEEGFVVLSIKGEVVQ